MNLSLFSCSRYRRINKNNIEVQREQDRYFYTEIACTPARSLVYRCFELQLSLNALFGTLKCNIWQISP